MFSDAQSKLNGLLDELGEKEAELLTSVRKAEILHDQTLDELGRKLDRSIESFNKLDTTLNNPSAANGNGNGRRNASSDLDGNVVVFIGEKLETLDKQRQRAKDSTFLIQCWTQLYETGELTSLKELMERRSGGKDMVRCAVISRQLMKMSQRLDQASWGQTNGATKVKLNGVSNGVMGKRGHDTKEIIERFSETLERELLKQFDSSYRKRNFEDMMECAKVLHDFNGGASAVALFVNQHNFFIGGDGTQLITDEVTTDSEIWEQLADPDSEPPGVEPSLQALVDEIEFVMTEESGIIKQAFPYYEVVLTKFIQRIFQQSLQQRLEKVVEQAETVSSLAFLRSLHASRTCIHTAIEEMKTHGLTENPEPCSAQTALSLDQQLEELFVPYLTGTSYIERERKSLEELYDSLLFKYTLYHKQLKQAPTGYFGSLVSQAGSAFAQAKDSYIKGMESSDMTDTQKAMLMRVAGVRDKDNNKTEVEVVEQDGELSIPNAKRMLKWLAEGVRRALELANGFETAKDVQALMNLLLDYMGQRYIQTALDAASAKALTQEASKTEPDLAYLPHLRPAITITNIMSRFVNAVLIRLAESNTTVRINMEKQAKTAVVRIESTTNNIMKSTITVVLNWITKLLARQQKNDFKPKEDSLDTYFDAIATPTCISICTFLSRVTTLLSEAIDGDNLENFSGALATSVRDLIFEHFKKYQVSTTGGLMVTKDMTKYTSTLRELMLTKEVETGLEVLQDVGQLFMVGAEALRERSRGFVVGGMASGKKMQKADFRAYIQRREDYSSVAIQSVVSSL